MRVLSQRIPAIVRFCYFIDNGEIISEENEVIELTKLVEELYEFDLKTMNNRAL